MNASAPTAGPVPAAGSRPGRVPAGAWSVLLIGAVAWVPMFWSSSGAVGADTKQYLYLDPSRLLARAPYLWDDHVAFGTVTHQNIGYLWPMGPFFWLFDTLGFPDWVAQRLWLGLLLFVAGTGARWLGRHLGMREGPATVAGLAYMTSPLILVYIARISAILMPWAALPWLVGLAMLALRRGGWAVPAVFALVVTTVGGVNATSLIYAGIGPVLWIAYAALVTREVPLGRALATVGRVGALTLLTQLWWIAGLFTQGRYGLPVLDFTETVESVSATSTATEIVRGLGNWFFYGRDQLGPWIEPSFDYTQRIWLIVLSFALPALALLAAAVVRWRHRAYALLLVLVGLVLAVGTHPHDDPTPLGWLFQEAAARSTFGLAMRSSPRAVPLVALGMALLLGAGLTALARVLHRRSLAVGAVALVGLMAAVNLWPLWTGHMVGGNLQRPEDLPAYWPEAAAWLDAQGDDTRVLELPGSDFAAYRWGNTVDPVTPGLMDRPWAARELIPFGSAPSADLLMALDRRLQEGVLDSEAIAPVARLLGVGDVVLRSDLQYERYRTPRPRPTWAEMVSAPGLGDPVGFGEPVPNVAGPDQPLLDEIALATPADVPDPPPVAAFPVDDTRPIVRVADPSGPVLLAGNGEGVVEASAAGLLDGSGPLFYAASLASDPTLAGRAVVPGALLVLTDSNRRAGYRWGTIRENAGYTEQAGEEAMRLDEADARLDVFPGSTDDSRTVAQQRGVGSVRATRYGNTVSYTPEDRPVLALDGDPTTAWRVGALGSALGERLRVELDEPVPADHLVLVQPQDPANRWITRATVRLESADGSVESIPVEFDDAGRGPDGLRVDFPSRELRSVEVRIDDTNVGQVAEYVGFSAVGLSEVRLGDVVADEVLRLPVDLLGLPGADSLDHPLAVVLGRLRADPADVYRADPERSMSRTFALPTGRAFGLEGEVRVSDDVADDVIDALLGLPGPEAGGVRVTSSDRLAGAPRMRASAALDGDPSTFWSSATGARDDRWIDVTAATPFTVDHLELTVVADGRHSVPTRLRLEPEGGVPVEVEVPAVADGAAENATTTVRVEVPTFTTSHLRVGIAEVREVATVDYYSGASIPLPVALAELGIAGVQAGPAAGIDGACRTDLVTVDGTPEPVRVVDGAAGPAEMRHGLAIEGCRPLGLDAGDHLVRTARGSVTGLDVDRLVLASAAGGAPATVAQLADGSATGDAASPAAPVVTVVDDGPVSSTVRVEGVDGPFWLVLGQSHNDGWEASLVGGGSLGRPVLIDGYANGWWVDPAGAGAVTIALDWTPQRVVWVGLLLSVLGVLACGVIAVVGRRRVCPVAAPAGGPLIDEPDVPELAIPLVFEGPRPSTRAAVVATVVAAAVGTLLLGIFGGLAVAVVVFAAVRQGRMRALVSVAPWLVVGLAGGYVAGKQLFADYRPQFAWPAQFEAAHRWVYLAVLVAVAEVVVAALWRRAGGPPDAEP